VDLAKIRKKAKKKDKEKEELKIKIEEAEDSVQNMPLVEEVKNKEEEVSTQTPPEIEAKIKKEKAKSQSDEKKKKEPTEENKEIKISEPIQEFINEKSEEVSSTKEIKLEKLLIFKVGKNRYAIPIGLLSQIIDEKELTPIPFVPPFLKGIFSLRGRIVGVIDVCDRLKIKRDKEEELRKIVVLEKDGDLFGLRVDGIDHVVDVDLNSLEGIEEGLEEESEGFVVGAFHYKNRTIALLNLDLFLNFNVEWRI
jgi:purine-binding chemotaxis protein CheW